MSCSRKLLVVDSFQRPNLRMPRKWNDSIPFVESMPGKDGDPGFIRNSDGGLRCVVKVSGQSLAFLESEREHVAAIFENVLECLDSNSELQFLTINRPIDPDKYLETYREMGPKENAYLDWYADYTSKWFRRVCECAMVPRKDFYIVVTEWKATNQLERLNRRVADVMQVLADGGLNSQLLTRSEMRRLIYTCMRLSYFTGLTDSPVETLTKSSLPKVPGASSKKHLVVDGQFVSSHVLSDLPSKAGLGWLMSLIVLDVLSSFSLHIRKGVNQQAHYELSLYAATFADSIEKLEEYGRELKRVFKEQGALLSADYDQYSAWISTLPLGIDCGGIAHLVPLNTANICWPFFSDSCGSPSGFPIGFSKFSREPVFLRPTEINNISVLASSRKDLRFFHSILAVRMLTSDCHILYLDNGQNEMPMLFDVLGPNLMNDLRGRSPSIDSADLSSLKKLMGKGARKYLEGNNVDDVKLSESASMTLMSTSGGNSGKELKRFRDAIQTWHSFYKEKKSLTIVISEFNQFEDVKGNEALLFLFDFANKNGISIIVGGLTSGPIALSQLSSVVQEHAEIKVILPMTQKGQVQAAKMFSLSEGESLIVNSLCKNETDQIRGLSCFLRTNANRGVIRVIPSPMDYWLCMPHNSELKKKIEKMKVGLKKKNPKLSNTDLVRQTVYYLGLQS